MPVSFNYHERQRAEMRQYSAIVRWMKIALPIGAILLIGLIFFAGRERTALLDADSIGDVAVLGAGLKLDNPRFAGVTDDGNPFVVTADWALPDGAMPDNVDLEKPKGEVHLGDGMTVKVTASTGEMRRKDEELHLMGEVELTSSDGYRARTDRVELDLATKSANVPGSVQAEGPRGSLQADQMQVEPESPDSRDLIVRFQGNVRVRINPPAE